MRNLNSHKLRYSLDRLCKFLDYTYNINNGGCCLIAYIIARNLDRLDINYSLVIYDDNKKDKTGIEKEILSMSKSSNAYTSITGKSTCIHYCLRITGGIINGDLDEDFIEYEIKNVKSRNIKWIYKTGKWNSDYDTKNTKVVRRIINTFFEQYG